MKFARKAAAMPTTWFSVAFRAVSPLVSREGDMTDDQFPTDDDTLGYYAEHAAKYAVDSLKRPLSPHMDYFQMHLPAHPRVLELGCGAGRDTADMIKRGFDVLPTDGSPEMAREAEARLGIPVKVMLFEELDMEDAFDGVWAHASLLHAPTRGSAKHHPAHSCGSAFRRAALC